MPEVEALFLNWGGIVRALPDLPALALFIGVAIALSAIPLVTPHARRQQILLGAGFIAAVTFYRDAALGLAVLGLASYVSALIIGRRASGPGGAAGRWQLACGALVALVGVFMLLQWIRYHRGSPGEGAARGIWLAAFDLWSTIRLSTFLWEIGSGRISVPAPSRFLLWYAYPFSLLGPVIRPSEFEAQLGKVQPSREREPFAPWARDLVLALGQMALGMALRVLANQLGDRGIGGRLAVLVVLAPWAFLLEAGGYFRAMEVLSRTWKVILPRSFNRPFGRPNLSEFWANWNMTVTSVFRDYLFYNRWGRRRPNVYVNSLILFALVGAWHSFNAYWVLWGLFHGIGFCIYLWYKQKGTSFRRLFQGRVGRAFAIGLTYLYVVTAWAIPPQLMKLFRLVL